MAGPSTANLSSYAPSRKVFSDASGIVNAELAGIGNANVNPLADIADGISSGIDLATKANKFLESISPEAAEERRLDLEIKKSQAAVQAQQGQAAQIQMQADALTKENTLLAEQLEAQKKVDDLTNARNQGALLKKAQSALTQIDDPQSLLDIVKSPEYLPLRVSPEFNKTIAQLAIRQLGNTTDPVMQAQLLKEAELSSPKSTEAIIKFLPPETQKLFADPKELAEIEKNRAAANRDNAAAEKDRATVQGEKAAAQAIKDRANQPAYDPLKESLDAAGVLGGQTKPTQPTTPLAPTASGASAPNQPQATPTPQPGEAQATTAAQAPKVGADGKPLRTVIVGTEEFQVDTPAPKTLAEAQKEQLDLAKSILKRDDDSRAWLDKWLAHPGTPKDKLIDKVTAETMREFPGQKLEDLTPLIKMKVEAADLDPKEYEERQGFVGNLQAMDTTVKKLEAAIMTIDAYVAKGGDPNIGPDTSLDRWFEETINKAQTNEEKAQLQSARDVLQGEGFVSVLQTLSGMKLGRISDMANTPVEKKGLEALSSGANATLQRNKQAVEILKGKVQQSKDILDITSALKRAGHDWSEATSVADSYFRTNPYLEVDQIDGVPSVRVKKNRLKVQDFLYNVLDIEKYQQRNEEGRAVTSKAPDQISLATEFADQVVQGTAKPGNASDIPNRMKEANMALVSRVALAESGKDFDPTQTSPKGAQGLMQLMPATGAEEWEKLKKQSWRELKFGGEYDPMDVHKNAIIGVSYLNRQLKDFNGDTRLALAAYNAGPGKLTEVLEAVDNAEKGMGRTDWNTVRNYLPKETRDYVTKIMGDKPTLAQERKSATPAEMPGAIATLKTASARQYAQENLSPDGMAALKETAEFKTIADTQGSVLEGVTSALLSLNPFGATEAMAAEPEMEVGPTDSRTRTLNEDGSISVDGENPDEGQQNYPDPETGMPLISPSLEDSEAGRPVFEAAPSDPTMQAKAPAAPPATSTIGSMLSELNPFRGPEEAVAETPEQGKTDAKKNKPGLDLQDIPDGLQAYFLGAARGLFFGGDDEIFAGARMILHGEDWDTAINTTRQIRDRVKEAYPWAYTLGEVGGGIINPLPGAVFKGAASVLKVGKGVKTAAGATAVEKAIASQAAPTVMSTAKAGAKAGAATGAVTGFLEGEGGIGNRAGAAAVSTAIGAGLGAAAAPVMRGAMALGDRVVNTETAKQVFSGLKKMVGKSPDAIENEVVKFSPGAMSLLNRLVGMTDEQRVATLTKLRASTDDDALSLLSELGDVQVEQVLEAISKNPNITSKIRAVADQNLSKEGERVTKLLNNFTDDVTPLEAADTAAGVITKQMERAEAPRKQAAEKIFKKSEEILANQPSRVSSKLNKYSQNVSSADAAKTLRDRIKSRVSRFYQERREVAGPIYDEAKQRGKWTAIDTKDPNVTRFRKRLSHTAPDQSTKEFNERVLLDANGKRIINEGDAVPRYEGRKNRAGELERAAFVSDGVFDAIDDPFVERAIVDAQRLLDPAGRLHPNDFDILQRAKIKLRTDAETLGGHEGELSRKAHEKLQKAMYDENPSYKAADNKYWEKSQQIEKDYSKGLRLLEKYGATEGQLNIEKIHEDVFRMGSDELTSLMNILDPADKAALRNSARSYITDQIENRGERGMPDFTVNKLPEKMKAIFGKDEGAAIIDDLRAEKNLTERVKKVAGLKSVENSGDRLERTLKENADGLQGTELKALSDEFTQASDSLRGVKSKPFEKLYKESVEGKTLNIRKLGDSLFKMGPKEISTMMKGMDFEEKRAFKNLARGYVLDKLGKRQARLENDPQRFADFTSDQQGEKFKAIFGDDEGQKLIDGLTEQRKIAKASSTILERNSRSATRAAENQFQGESRVAEETSQALVAGGVAAASPNMASVGYGVYRGIRALGAKLRAGHFKKEQEIAEEISKIGFTSREAAIKFLDDIGKAAGAENPEYAKVWQRVASIVAEMESLESERGEGESSERERQEARELYPERSVNIVIKGPGKTVSAAELEAEKNKK